MKKNIRKTITLLSLIFVFLNFSSFKHFNMNYTSKSGKKTSKNFAIQVNEFEDHLANKGTVSLLNDLSKTSNKIFIKNGVTNWISDGLRKELTQFGYTINDSTAQGIEICGEIKHLDVDAGYFYNGYIELNIIWKHNGKIVSEKVYEKVCRGDINWLYTNRGLRNILNKTLRRILADIVEDINQGTM